MASPSAARQCWICLGEGRVGDADWVSPCACRGSTRWVHQACLLAWLASTHPGMETTPVLPPGAPPPADTTPALQALQHASFYPTDAPRCPQCHTPYRVTEQTVLPRPVMAVLQRVARAAESTIVAASIAGTAAAAYVVASSYGLAAVCALRAESPAAVLAHALAGVTGAAHWREAVRSAAALLRVGIGLPLVPLYALSVGQPSLSLLYPLAPVLAYGGPGSLDVRTWPPATTAAALPFVAVLYSQARRAFFSRLLRRTRAPSAAAATPLIAGSAETSALASDDPSRSTSAPLSATASPDTTELLMAEEEEERVVHRSILDTAASLLLPFAASAAGLLLFRRLPRWLPAALSRPLNRAALGGLVVLCVRDAITTIAALQRRLSRTTRRVLDYEAP